MLETAVCNLLNIFSEVANIHHGLDRCASLLRDILQNESQGNNPFHYLNIKFISLIAYLVALMVFFQMMLGMADSSQKTVKTTTFKAASRPLLNKMGGTKKRGVKKRTPSANVQKETGMHFFIKFNFLNHAFISFIHHSTSIT